MDFKKCNRCGSFFASNNNICPKCTAKDRFEISALKTYLEENDCDITIESISIDTGISAKNINRYLETEEFTDLSKTLLKNNSFGNIGINL